MLDSVKDGDAHASAIGAQMRRLKSPGLTPYGKVPTAVNDCDDTFMQFSPQLSLTFAADFRARPPASDGHADVALPVLASLEKQLEMERAPSENLDWFIVDYRSPSHASS